MRAVKNCLFCLKTIFHYVPLHTLTAAVCFFVPAAFAGLQVLVLQRIVDSALWNRTGNCSRRVCRGWRVWFSGECSFWCF